jgi:hypothetical protein
MHYYTFELDEESSKMCVIVTPFGRFYRTQLAMGLKPSADWAQTMMHEIFDDIMHELEVYFDGILTSHMAWDPRFNVVSA